MFGNKRTSVKPALQIGGWLLLVLLSIAPFGCSEMMQKSDLDGTIVRTYLAVFSPVTKTAVSSEGDVSWSAGDQVWYYSQDGGQVLSYTVAQDAVSADLTLTLAAQATYLTAIYGTSGITGYSKDAITLANVVKAEQAGSFIDGHVAVARTTQVNATSLDFYNLVSFVTFSTNRTDIAYVVFSSNDDTPLHANGAVSVQYSEGIPTASFGSNPENSIKVNLNGAGLYFIATLPSTLQNGFTLSCYNANDKLIGTATGNNVLSIKRTTIARLGIIDSRLVDPNGINLSGYGPDTNWDGTQNSGANIINSKYGEDYNWDTNGDSNANLNKDGYNKDSNWDSNSNSNANVGKGGYNGDSNWDSNTNTGGNLSINGYGNDSNWN